MGHAPQGIRVIVPFFCSDTSHESVYGLVDQKRTRKEITRKQKFVFVFSVLAQITGHEATHFVLIF